MMIGSYRSRFFFKGDSLIHAVAAKGDSHGAVLAELLSLRTQQGTTVFDLSKRNYDGTITLSFYREQKIWLISIYRTSP